MKEIDCKKVDSNGIKKNDHWNQSYTNDNEELHKVIEKSNYINIHGISQKKMIIQY